MQGWTVILQSLLLTKSVSKAIYLWDLKEMLIINTTLATYKSLLICQTNIVAYKYFIVKKSPQN